MKSMLYLARTAHLFLTQTGKADDEQNGTTFLLSFLPLSSKVANYLLMKNNILHPE
jgi:hypothetical protein